MSGTWTHIKTEQPRGVQIPSVCPEWDPSAPWVEGPQDPAASPPPSVPTSSLRGHCRWVWAVRLICTWGSMLFLLTYDHCRAGAREGGPAAVAAPGGCPTLSRKSRSPIKPPSSELDKRLLTLLHHSMLLAQAPRSELQGQLPEPPCLLSVEFIPKLTLPPAPPGEPAGS